VSGSWEGPGDAVASVDSKVKRLCHYACFARKVQFELAEGKAIGKTDERDRSAAYGQMERKEKRRELSMLGTTCEKSWGSTRRCEEKLLGKR